VTGRLVAAIGTALLHHRTIALVLEPALADLTFEDATSSQRGRVEAHKAALAALGWALWHDLVWEPRGPAWTRGVAMLTTLCGLVAAYHAAMLTLILGFDGRLRAPAMAHVLTGVSSVTIALWVVVSFGAGVAWVVRRTRWATEP
jgi:hypothetical protein